MSLQFQHGARVARRSRAADVWIVKTLRTGFCARLELTVERAGLGLMRTVLDFVLDGVLQAQDLAPDRLVRQPVRPQARNDGGDAPAPIGVGVRAVNLLEFIGD